MFGERFEINEQTLGFVEEIGRHMPGGFFIYRAEQPEDLLYANQAVFDIFGCKDIEEFKELTGYTFKGMLHPEDYAAISDSIVKQIDENDDNMDYVEYRVIRKDGAVRWVDDFGHFTDTRAYGGIYYVFISDITEKKEQRLKTMEKALQDVERAEAEAEMARIRAAEAEARAKLEIAEEANRAKSLFLSNMSHEIRTPITAILGMNELIRRESTDKNVQEYAASIESAGVSLLGIINDILDFSKIEAGKMELVDAEYRVSTLLADALNLTRLKAEEKGLVLKTDIDPRLPSVLRGDDLRIKQILTNLLSNAVKYTETGSVSLICKLVGKRGSQAKVFVSVFDTGIGIKEDEREKLFSAFDRLDVIRTRGIEGTGLGLAITSQILALMGSKLEVESTYGEGSDFFFTLTQEIVDEAETGSFDPLEAEAEKGNARRGRGGLVAPEANLLIVDDTPLNLKVIAGLLKRTQMKIDTAASGAECVERFGSDKHYDMVFLDYRMPEMDGIETLHRIYSLYPDKADKTPIICLTASAVSGDRERMLSAGFDDYLSKPVDIAKMEDMMRKYLPENLIQDKYEYDSAGSTKQDADAYSVRAANSRPFTEDAAVNEELSKLPSELFSIEEIDAVAGIEFCGDAEELIAALEIYEASINDKADNIERTAKTRDAETYINLVHSLKSTSKAVGATALSELALKLEMAGKNGDIIVIDEETPALLKRYRALKEPLKKALEG